MNSMKLVVGDTLEITGSLTNPDNNNAVVDITDYVFTATATENSGSSTPINLTCTILNAVMGAFSIDAAKEITGTWKANKSYTVKVRYTTPEGKRTTFPMFVIKMLLDV